MDGRKRLSGSAYRKIADIKRKKESELIKKVPKLDNFFTTNKSRVDSGVGVSNNINTFSEESEVEHISVADANEKECNSNGDCRPSKPESCVSIFSPKEDESHKDTGLPTPTILIDDRPTSSTSTHPIDSLFMPSNDPYNWEINDKTIDYLVKNDIEQNINADFSKSIRLYPDGSKRACTKSMFSRRLLNGGAVERKYLVYSPSQGSIFCAPCRLFGGTNTTAFSSEVGFNDWVHAGKRISEHENSKTHMDCLLQLKRRGVENSRIDHHILSQHEQEVKYWKSVLQRVVSVIKKLSSRGLPFRGENEVFGSIHNGNFMMCLELIAEYDPFLSEHIARYGNPGSGFTSYLSSTVCEELIKVMGESVSSKIVEQIKSSKYYSLIIDSSPDITHVDQLSFIVRYVNENGTAEERFVSFIANPGHTGENLADAVFKTLSKFDLDIENCRGQSYDNASNMAGKYIGLQARVKSANKLVYFVPCAAHSLNLSGSKAAMSSEVSRQFFEFLQSLYNFFSCSNERWNLLLTFFNNDNLTLKTLSQTRWSAREDACKSLGLNWQAICMALEQFINDDSQKDTYKNQAKGVLRHLLKLETAFMSLVWNAIFTQYGKTMTKLQKEDMDVSRAVLLIDSLVNYIEELKKSFKMYFEKAIKLNEETVKTQNVFLAEKSEPAPAPERKRKRKKFFDESSSEAEGEETLEEKTDSSKGKKLLEERNLINERKMQSSFNSITNSLVEDIEKRATAYKEFATMFDFLTKLETMDGPNLSKSAKNLCEMYSKDIEINFEEECLHLKGCLKNIKNEITNKKGEKVVVPWTLPSLYKMIVEKNLQDIYPNICIALKIYCCTPATSCSAERSFSVLRRIKNYLRSSQGQERLVNSAMLCVESDITVKLDFEDIINTFAKDRSRRKPLI